MVNVTLSVDHANRKYSPGDVMNLEARVHVSFEQKYRSIYARVKEWTESRQVQRGGKSYTEYTTYSSNESFFQNYQTLAGARSGPEQRLSAGTYVYHARFVLPRNLPQNHEHEYGHIRYQVKVHMDVPWGFDEKETLSFDIIPRFDLNDFPHLREPVRDVADKTFGCCCWESEPLFTYNSLPRTGFVPGERVQYTLEMKNASDVGIDGVYVKLAERITYHAHSPSSKTRESSRTLWSHEFTRSSNRQLVAPLQNKVFSTELYFNPSWDFQFFNGCGIITVEYYLKSGTRTLGCHTNLSNRTEITMGTISLGNFGPAASTAPFPTVPSAPLAPLAMPSAPPICDKPICEQPLPSYNETVSQPGTAIGWAASNLESPPPAFTEVQFDAEKIKTKEDKTEKQ